LQYIVTGQSIESNMQLKDVGYRKTRIIKLKCMCICAYTQTD